MQESIDVEIKVIKQVFLWFMPYQSTDPEVLNNDSDNGVFKANVTHSFDFEKVKKEQWIIHIDIGINVIPLAKIRVRTSFQVSCPDKVLLSPEILDTINKMAIKGAEKGFLQECKVHNIAHNFTKMVDAEDLGISFRDNIINQFNNRKNNNSSLTKINKGALSFTTGLNTLLITHGTFIILDNVLHVNRLFDLAHNQKVFHEAVPEPIYYTIKLICMELNEKKINLVFLHAALFQICLDCAIQLLLDRHAQTLQPALIEADFFPDKQKKFIEYGSSSLRDFRKAYKISGSRVENLEIKYDWNSLIK